MSRELRVISTGPDFIGSQGLLIFKNILNKNDMISSARKNSSLNFLVLEISGQSKKCLGHGAPGTLTPLPHIQLNSTGVILLIKLYVQYHKSLRNKEDYVYPQRRTCSPKVGSFLPMSVSFHQLQLTRKANPSKLGEELNITSLLCSVS